MELLKVKVDGQWVEVPSIKGEKGEKGDAFTYADFTEAQKMALIQGPIKTAQDAAVDVVEDAGSDQVAAVGAKGEEVRESIPADYTELSDEVSALNSAFTAVTGNTRIEWTDGYRIPTNVSPIDITPVVNAGTRCAVISCSAGDVFTLNGQSTNSSVRAFAFLDSSKAPIQMCPQSQLLDDYIISAPTGTAYLVLNDTLKTKDSFYGALLKKVVKNNRDIMDQIATLEPWNLCNLDGIEIVENTFINGNTISTGTATDYFSVRYIPVKPGHVYEFYSDNADHTDARFVNFYTSDKTYISQSVNASTATAPSNAAYMSVSYYYKTMALGPTAVKGNYYARELGTVRDVVSLGNNLITPCTNSERKASICFQLDDATTPENPTEIKAIFDAHGYHIGWVLPTHDNSDVAITSETVTRHLGYQASGDEIICHGKNHTIDWTDITQSLDTIEGYIKTSRDTLIKYGFNIDGFVPTMSAMAEEFRPLLRRYFQYGYSVYIGAYDNTKTRRAFSYPSDGNYNMWRVSAESSTLDNMKAAVDEAIEHGGCLTFYAHPLYWNASGYTFTTANLTALLDYIQAKENAGLCVFGTPSEVIRNYFNPRNDDISPDWELIDKNSVSMDSDMEATFWGVYFSKHMGLLTFDCAIRPNSASTGKTGEFTICTLPFRVNLNNTPIQNERGLDIRIVNNSTSTVYTSSVNVIGNESSWARLAMNRLHCVCMIQPTAAQRY